MPAKAAPRKRTVGAKTGAEVRLWMLDFDGTIAHLQPEVDWAGGRRVLEPYLRSAGAPADLFVEIPQGNLPLYDAYRARLAANGAISRAAAAVLRRASEIIEDLELAGVDRAQPIAGAHELISQLRAEGAKVAIVTANSSRTVARWFKVNRAPAPDAIIGRDTMLALKPSPATVIRALETFSVRPIQAAFAGDTEADLIAAREAGVRFYGVAMSAASRERLAAAGARKVFDSPAALANHLRRSTPARHRGTK
ncbi:MAG TPA: HAD-IA family hydrolase [Candidatus Binataceae bacterium]|nr:HAD-IA family hydrolase [Candidatus Binataceae bacterium]